MPEAQLQAQGLAVARAGVTVLRDLALQLLPGQPLALLGPSGSGKTSLLMVLAGVIPPAAGQVLLRGQDLFHLSASGREQLRRGELALLSQELELLPHLSAERNAALTGLLAGRSAGEALARAREELEALDMGAFLRRPASALSRGQRQRVALARALAHPGALLLLDEPSTALDPVTRGRLLERLSLRAQAGHSVLVATHDPELAAWASVRMALRGQTLVSA